MKDYYEDLWERLPPDPVEGRGQREAFLRSHLNPGDRVLDLGCGDGWALPVIAECGAAEIVGADVAQAALARAARRAGADMATLVHVEFDGPLPLEDNRFDLVWAGEVLEHVADTARWLSEVRRVLVPDGRLLLTTPNVSRFALLIHGVDRYSPPLGDHVHLYTHRSLTTLLTELGFDQLDIRTKRRTLLAKAHRR